MNDRRFDLNNTWASRLGKLQCKMVGLSTYGYVIGVSPIP